MKSSLTSQDVINILKDFNEDMGVAGAVECVSAHSFPSKKDPSTPRFLLRTRIIENCGDYAVGDWFHVAGEPAKRVELLSTSLLHNDGPEESWFVCFLVRPQNVVPEELSDVLLIVETNSADKFSS